MDLRASRVRRADVVRTSKRVAKGLTAGVVCVQLAGCMALRLSSRGAPEEEMREFEIQFEAVDLPAVHDGGDHEQPVLSPLWATVPVSGWLHGFDYHLVDAEGNPVPREVLHHLKVMDPDRRELFNPIMLHLAGSGGETMPVLFPREVGYPIEEGDTLLVTAMLHNTTGRSLEGVQLLVALHYSPHGSWKPPLPVVPFFTHVTSPMSEPSYDLPPGLSEKSIELRPAVSGRILGLGGHLHRYGVSLRLEDTTEGRVLWEREARRSPDGHVLEIPHQYFVWSRGPKLRSDHTYRLTAVHDNPTGDTIPGGGMGTLGGAMVMEESWPEVDRLAAEYIWYLNREATPSRALGHQHR